MNARDKRETIAANALEIENYASEWIERRYFGVWSTREEAELSTWRAQSLAHEIAFLRLEAGWGRTERLAALRSRNSGNSVFNATGTNRRFLIRAAVITAVWAIFSVMGMVYLSQPSGQIYSTPIGGHKTIVLADGSQIELNTDTLIRANIGRAARKIELLKGEAYFQIKHDAARPFVVIAAGNRLTDLGTSFFIRSEADRVKVGLLEGRLELEPIGNTIRSRSVILVPGDVATASANSISIAKKPTGILAADLGWRKGVLIFHDALLADAAAEFNRYNRRKLVIADTDAARRVIGATFPTGRVDLFANAVRNVLGLRVENRGDQIIISR